MELYILKSPQSFITQFSGNAAIGNRLGALTHPLAGAYSRDPERYFTGFGLGPHSVGHSGLIRLKALILLTYVVALIGALMVGEIRRNKGYRTLLILALIFFLTLSIGDNQKETWYLIHVIPVFTAILAVVVVWCWNKRFVPRWLVAGFVVCFVVLQLGGVLQRIRLDTYHTDYLPAVEFLKTKVNNGQVVMGSAELGFGLNSFDNLIDDSRLGFFSGKRPDFIVVEEVYQSQIDGFEAKHPDLYQYTHSLLTNEYHKIYDHENYQIYARGKAPVGLTSAEKGG